jgi:DNA-binding transcriptional ArsR family regulator
MQKRAFFVKLFKSLANSARLELMLEMAGGEKNVTELVKSLKHKQSSVSHNLHNLISAGLVNSRHQGAFRYYSLQDSGQQVVDAIRTYVPPPALVARVQKLAIKPVA